MKYKSIVLLIIGMIFWMAYLYDQDMSRYGIYTLFNFNTHEVLSMIPLVSIVITAIWIVYLLIESFRERKIKSHKIFCIIFIVLFITQTMYIKKLYQTFTTTIYTSISKINKGTMEIIIDTDDYDLTLDCPMIVLDLLKTDGTEYGIQYEFNEKNPSYGKLSIVQTVD